MFVLFSDVQRHSPGLAEDSLSPHQRLLDEGQELFVQEDPPVEFKSYKRRFYILLLFSVIGFSQYCAWNTYGPIATTAKLVFDWTNTEIAFLASMDPITYLCTMLFFSWMMDEKGIGWKINRAWCSSELLSLTSEWQRIALCILYQMVENQTLPRRLFCFALGTDISFFFFKLLLFLL